VLLATPASLATAREFTRDALRRWNLFECRADTLVVVNELVTNAIIHGEGPVTLTMTLHDSVLHIVVRDHSPIQPASESPTDERTSGRGLAIVEAMTTDWGYSRSANAGKDVWADIVAVGAGDR
jgi:anti-sigma regulatory factor (Ser/Thr protein kinase)